MAILPIFLYLGLLLEMNVFKKIKLLKLLFCLASMGSFAQNDTLPGKLKNTVFQSKNSSQSDTLPDGVILENLPAPKIPKNAVFAEIFTNGGLYSLNYDRILFVKNKVGTSIRTGVFFLPEAQGAFQTSIVLEPNLLIGNEKYFFETGLGFTRFVIMERRSNNENRIYKQTDWENYFTIRAGLRIQSRNEHGLFFRAGLTPVFYYMDSEGSGWYGQILGGVGFGVSF